MDHPVFIDLREEKRAKPAITSAPSSELAELRAMFQEMDQRYMVYEPPTYYYTFKRAVDITISMLFIILVMSWLTPLVALLIKITSRGPVFFIQKRTGYKGVEFDCFKFRTMYVNNDAHVKQATTGDKRITPVGKFLRLTHIDETAQFFNVLLGDMSVIGPRPHMLFHTENYARLIPYYNLRHEAQPGMTGMAQIKGYIGEINIDRELRKRVQWDIYYLKNRSIWMDLKILFITGCHVIMKILHIPIHKD